MENKKVNTETNKEVMIECKNLTKAYNGFKALDNLNLDIVKGEIFAFVGHNGAGKTTTMNLLVGLIEPTSGDAFISGHSIIKDQNVNLYSGLTARQTVKYIADLNGGVAENKIDETLDRVGLEKVKDKRAEEFSKGMKQRLGIACVLVKDPEVLFLDEPTSGLDPTGKMEVQDLLKKLGDEGITIFYASHILGEVEDIADRVGILYQGKLQKILGKDEIEKVGEIYKEISVVV